MFFYGKNITQSHLETLVQVTSYEIYQKITNPEPETAGLLERLQRIKTIDRKAYDAVKKRLPFFTCSEFANGIRKTENFVAAHGLILDLDHCLLPEENGKKIRSLLTTDPRILLLFTSPGGNGLKIVFRFEVPCTSPKIFSDFYKWFANDFSHKYGIEQFTDFTTHDVSRVCFVSMDKEAHHNPLCEAIDWKPFAAAVVQDCPWFDSSPDDAGNKEKNNKPETTSGQEVLTQKNDDSIDPETYAQILKKLNPQSHVCKKKIIYVPEQLNKIADPVREEAGKYQIELAEVRDIHYGKKLVFQHGINKAEINVYYGKNGFSVVITPKAGNNEQLAEVVKRITEEAIWKLFNIPYIQKKLTNSVNQN